jgi:hypothetical protein
MNKLSSGRQPYRENQLMLYALAFSANQGLEFQTSGEIAPPFSQALNSYEIEN